MSNLSDVLAEWEFTCLEHQTLHYTLKTRLDFKVGEEEKKHVKPNVKNGGWPQLRMAGCAIPLPCGVLCKLTWLFHRFFAETQDLLQFVMISNAARRGAIPSPPGISHFRKYIKLRYPIKSSETLRWNSLTCVPEVKEQIRCDVVKKTP